MPDTETKTPAGAADLSLEIAKAVLKKPREQVTCRRISGSYYRCNWWAPQDSAGYDNPRMNGPMVTTSRICKSQFLHVTKIGDDLTMQVMTGNAPRVDVELAKS